MRRMRTVTAILTLIFGAAMAFAAGPYGSLRYNKRGIMNGNQVSTEFYN